MRSHRLVISHFFFNLTRERDCRSPRLSGPIQFARERDCWLVVWSGADKIRGKTYLTLESAVLALLQDPFLLFLFYLKQTISLENRPFLFRTSNSRPYNLSFSPPGRTLFLKSMFSSHGYSGRKSTDNLPCSRNFLKK